MEQTVRDYHPISDIDMPAEVVPMGDSVSPKGMITHILTSNAEPVSVLDIGFGMGTLGAFIKTHPECRHWSVDGVDGWGANCRNKSLIEERRYRNIWHGLAQELPAKQLQSYRIICLLDVVEHLPASIARDLVRTLLSSMADNALLFISTPLWFYPQDALQEGDLEEHQIGVPASSMLAMNPIMYSVNHPLVGGFVYDKSSLQFADFFQPTTNKEFSFEMGMQIVRMVRMEHTPGVVYKCRAV